MNNLISFPFGGNSRKRFPRNLCASFLIFAVFLSLPSALFAQPKSANFIIVSDMGGFASENQKSVAAAMGKEASKIDARFVVTLGDNYHGKGITSENDPRWKTEFEDIYDVKSLQIPWYPCLGNHDYEGNPQAEINYSKISPRWKFPARYYTQEEIIDSSTSLLIVHIDTSPFIDAYRNDTSKGKTGWPDIAKQLSWLDSVLAVSKAQWTIVVGHHPLFASTAKNGDQKELIEKVLPILQKHHVLFYICGHQHFLQYLRKENMHFLICGGGSSFWDPAPGKDVVFEKGSLGFLSVQITKNLFRADFINSEEKILYTVTVQN